MMCISGFVDDYMFSYNGRNTPKSKTTRIFRPILQVATPVGRQTTLFRTIAKWRHPGEVCRLRLHLILIVVSVVNRKCITVVKFSTGRNGQTHLMMRKQILGL